jgi:hypothetical protein
MNGKRLERRKEIECKHDFVQTGCLMSFSIPVQKKEQEMMQMNTGIRQWTAVRLIVFRLSSPCFVNTIFGLPRFSNTPAT